MKYVLVIQWPVVATEDYDLLVAVEELLIDKLSETHEVDGHDVGSSEFNIFIHTDNFSNAFYEIKEILSKQKCWDSVRIAYREQKASIYTVLWPEHEIEFRVL
jgi:hypothetical protein